MIHDDAVDLVQFFEGCQNTAYACPAHTSNGGTWPYLTIGYGHSGPDVQPGQQITTAQARELLARDLTNVETMVRQLVSVPLNAQQIGAACALAMNLKPGLFRKSTALARLNAGDFGNFDIQSAYRKDLGSLSGMARAWAEFRNVTLKDGSLRVERGLVKRRAAELELFFNGKWAVPYEDRMPQQVAPANAEPEMFRPGFRDQQVADLHDALAAAGFPTTCGDAYTWVTVDAVKAFQAKHGLKVDGLYGPETARMLHQVLNGGA